MGQVTWPSGGSFTSVHNFKVPAIAHGHVTCETEHDKGRDLTETTHLTVNRKLRNGMDPGTVNNLHRHAH